MTLESTRCRSEIPRRYPKVPEGYYCRDSVIQTVLKDGEVDKEDLNMQCCQICIQKHEETTKPAVKNLQLNQKPPKK